MVLVGGASRRMGRDKATLTVPGRFDGRTLVEQVVAVVRQRCSPVFVVAAPDQVLPELAATVLRDDIPGLGPLPAVGAGLAAAAAAGAGHAFVCAVDMPYLSVDVIDALGASAAESDADLLLPWDGRDHYLCGMYRTRLAETITALVARGERRMKTLPGLVETRRVTVADPRALANLNSPADLPAPRPQR